MQAQSSREVLPSGQARRGTREALIADFPSFIARCFATVNPGSDFLENWHIDLIAEYLEAARRGEIHRLIINMPPRSLKSVAVSVAWPAYLLGHNPSARIMAASYASSLSLKHSLDCRLVMQSRWYRSLFPGTKLTADQNEKQKFMTTKRGYRLATSVGGAATGEGGDVLIVDDPLSAMQAESPLQRQVANDWFDHTFATRLDDKQHGCIVVVMQRLHTDDLSGHLLRKGGWEHLSLPAIATQPMVYSCGATRHVREEGEILHPERENNELLERAKRELGSQAFAAQYQQQPLPVEGSMVKLHWLQRYEQAPTSPHRIVQSWDTAIKAGAQHDRSACLTFAEYADMFYLLDACIMRAEYPHLKRAVIHQAQRWKADAVLIEDKASGQSLIQDLRRESRLAVIARMPKGDKVTRFAAVSAMIEAGRLFLPHRASWLTEFETETLTFPHASHDDQVDALTQFLFWVRERRADELRVRPL